ncbi:MAG TPA: NAD(P)/FAD-dependent oxidoreductase, partial [Candidatus Methanoperedenaceae archaeon]|nr:NAD(P)/FAD-dependent oxidoreductase [Candidatus Methanoperedenaceae archaeon]
MKAIIVGAGLGGLLSAAKLSQKGYEVEVFERLPIIGGRFTNIKYKGFTLSTGALHMIPHGNRGPLGQLLKDVGAKVNIVQSNPMAVVRLKNQETFKDIPFESFASPLSFKNKLKLALLTLKSKMAKPGEISFRDWFYPYINDEWIVRFADSFCGWAISLRSADVPAKEAIAIIGNVRRFGGPGVPVGGCGAVVEALKDVIESNGGMLHTRTKVERIEVKDGKAAGVVAGNQEFGADIVISDTGHEETGKLCCDMDYNLALMRNPGCPRPSEGIKICLSSDEPLIGHTGVLFTPYCERINGINEVTNADPSLAPEGKHLVMSHQALLSGDVESEIRLGLRDLRSLFPKANYEVLMVQSYRGSWPVNRAASGCDAGNETPVKHLYVVGDGAKGKGGIEVEGIAM